MHFDTTSVTSIVIAVITAVGVYAGARATVRANKAAAEPANWQALTAEMKEFFKEQLAQRDERISALEGELVHHREYVAYLAAIPEFTDPPFPSFAKWRAGRGVAE